MVPEVGKYSSLAFNKKLRALHVYTYFCHVHIHVLKFFTFVIAKYFGINIPSSGEYQSRFLKQTRLIKMEKCNDDELRVQSTVAVIITDVKSGCPYRGAIFCHTFPHY